ncbi:MAG: hypothetical protein JRM80_10035 [Nitrososphaerota archaeon]|nr:hypothetical protein [Nitrososphaerota archaeon]
MIVLGVGFNFYLLSLFGVFMLIPAVTSRSRQAPKPSGPTRQEPVRVSPKPQPPETPPVSQPMPKQSVPVPISPQPASDISYSPSLFPKSMFPPMSLMGDLPQPPTGAEAKQSGRDEVVETGAMLALLRLILG